MERTWLKHITFAAEQDAKGILCRKGGFKLALSLAVSRWLVAAQHDGRVRRFDSLEPQYLDEYNYTSTHSSFYTVQKHLTTIYKVYWRPRRGKVRKIALLCQRAREKLTLLDKWPTGKREVIDPEVVMITSTNCAALCWVAIYWYDEYFFWHG